MVTAYGITPIYDRKLLTITSMKLSLISHLPFILLPCPKAPTEIQKLKLTTTKEFIYES